MAPNADEDVLIKAVAPLEDRAGLRSRTSNGEDIGGGKDRERPRQQAIPTRPTLSAVGRVASRVRTSGISKFSTLLQNGKDYEDVNASPWGVGQAAMARSQSTSVIPKGLAKSASVRQITSPLPKSGSVRQRVSPLAKSMSVRQIASPKTRDSSDFLEMSSPMSTDTAQSPPTEQAHATIAADDKARAMDPPKFSKAGSTVAGPRVSRPSPALDRVRAIESDRAKTPESPMQGKIVRHGEARPKPLEAGKMLERLGSKTVKSKFRFRPSLQIESQSPANGEGNIASPFALEEPKSTSSELRPNENALGDAGGGKGTNPGDGNEPLTSTESKEKDNGNLSTSRVTFVSSPTVGHELERMESTTDVEKSRMFHFTPFGRSKSRPAETQKRKSKAETPRGKIGMSRAKSQSGKKHIELERVLGEDSQLSVPRKKSSQISQGKASPVVKGKKGVWFNLRKGDNGTDRASKQGGAMKGRTTSKREEVIKDQDKAAMGPDFFAKQTSKRQDEPMVPPRTHRLGRKSRKSVGLGFGTTEVADLGIEIVKADEYVINSDDEEAESAAHVRSLAVDDFISYQTKQSKKGKAKS